MYDRYKIRTYQDNIYQENSDTDSENELDNIPFKKALFTNNHILDKTKLENNKEDKFNKKTFKSPCQIYDTVTKERTPPI